MKRITLTAFTLLFAGSLLAKSFLTQEEALKLAFPNGADVERQSVFLSDEERAKVAEMSGVDFEDELVVRYVAKKDGKIAGYAYFDAHRVRTLPETIMVVVTPDATISRIEILSFSEPQEYLPRERWLGQLVGKSLGDELSLTRSIRPITGATLSGRAIVNASRNLLAVHRVVEGRGGSR